MHLTADALIAAPHVARHRQHLGNAIAIGARQEPAQIDDRGTKDPQRSGI